MFIGNVTAGQISSLVWTAAARSLVTLGPAVQVASNANVPIGTSTGSVGFVAGAGSILIITIGVIHPAGGNNTVTVVMGDGTNTYTIGSVAVGASAVFGPFLIAGPITLTVANHDTVNAAALAYSEVQLNP